LDITESSGIILSRNAAMLYGVSMVTAIHDGCGSVGSFDQFERLDCYVAFGSYRQVANLLPTE